MLLQTSNALRTFMLLQTSNALRTFMYLNAAAALIHSYFISQTTKGCYCQQIGEGGVSPGAMLNMQPTYD